MRQPLPLTATPSHDLKALLSWPDITEPAWTKTPTVSYALYRDGTEVTDYDGNSRSYTDAGLTNRQEYTYQVALLLDGAEVQRSKAVSMTAENRPYFGEAAIDNQLYMENEDVGTVTLPVATGGDGTLVYTMTPDLPAGLSFDAVARTISGTPTEPQEAKEYTYTATDDDGDTATLTFTIKVEEDLEPTFGEEAIGPQAYTENTDIGTVTLPEATSGDGELSYTLTPDLPAGLNFDVGARTITGTPTEPFDETEYTYKVADEDGDTEELTFTIAIANNPPSFGSDSVQAQAYTENTEIDTITLPAASGGDDTLTYTLTPEPPDGLSFDAAARTITGTPSEPQDATGYTYKVTDGDGETTELTFTIAIANNPPSFGQEAVDSQVYTENTDVGTVNLPAATGGDGGLSYTLTPEPPDGLSFDAAARTITGTPAEPQDATGYTYKATDGDGETAELTFTIVIANNPPSFSQETVQAQAYTENAEIDTLTLPAATGGDGTLVYTLAPEPPAGLSFDSVGRTISGIPTEPLDATGYTYKVTDGDGETAELTFTIAIANNPPSFGQETVQAQAYTENAEIDTLTLPAATGGDGTLVYTLAPEPPAGLSFDSVGRTISGIPTEPLDATGYTYKVTDGDGETAELTFTIAIANNPPSFGQETVPAQVYTENMEIDTVTLPVASGGDGTLTYTLTPEPPAGLSLDAAARTITGTPTEPQDATEYTYKATDGDGETAELTFTIEVEEDLEPTFGEEAIDSQVYMQSRDIGTLTLPEATGGDGTLDYTLTPDLPAGLSFDPGDRSISGIPSEPQDETEYTYTVADADGDEASLTFTIEVEADLTPPVLTPVELVMSPTNDNTPSVVFISSEPGTLVYGGDCGNPTPSEITTADTETTLTYPQLADGEYSGCSVAITDAAGNTGYPAVHPSFWDIVVDTQAPELESAVVAHPFGDIVLRFSEEISWFEKPDTGAFQVFVDGVQAEVQYIAIGWPGNGHDQREVLLELSLSTPEGSEVVVNYHHVDTLSPLQDHAGNLFPSGRYEVGQ